MLSSERRVLAAKCHSNATRAAAFCLPSANQRHSGTDGNSAIPGVLSQGESTILTPEARLPPENVAQGCQPPQGSGAFSGSAAQFLSRAAVSVIHSVKRSMDLVSSARSSAATKLLAES